MSDCIPDSFVVDPHPVDDRVVLRKPEQAGLRVAGLWLRCKGPDLYEREPEPRQFIVEFSVLSRPAASPTGAGKSMPKTFLDRDGVL